MTGSYHIFFNAEAPCGGHVHPCHARDEHRVLSLRDLARLIADALQDVGTGDLMVWRLAGDGWDDADEVLAQHDSAVVTGSEVVAQDMDEIRRVSLLACEPTSPAPTRATRGLCSHC
jgi:hypothetical protein